MNNNSIKISDLHYKVKEGESYREILNGITCDIPEGVLTTISGPSGSGKTTFLYAMAGLINDVSGSVEYGGESIYSMSPAQRDAFRLNNISFIFQHLNLFNFLNVEDNIKINQIMRNEKITPELEKKIDKYLDLMKLGNIRKKPIQSLSGGERQRVAIIRAFISDAKYIFSDEPTGNLDSKNSLMFMDCLKDIMSENNATIVLVTHDSKIFNYGDNKIYIEDGKISEDVKITEDRLLIGA